MDILKQIRAWTKKNGRPPWPIGVDLTKASDVAKFAAQLLSSEELIAISRFNRFKSYRNETIREIKSEHGIPLDVIAELTGLGFGTVRVLNSKKGIKSE